MFGLALGTDHVFVLFFSRELKQRVCGADVSHSQTGSLPPSRQFQLPREKPGELKGGRCASYSGTGWQGQLMPPPQPPWNTNVPNANGWLFKVSCHLKNKKNLQASNEWLFENRQVHRFFEVGPSSDFSSKVAQIRSVIRHVCRKKKV